MKYGYGTVNTLGAGPELGVSWEGSHTREIHKNKVMEASTDLRNRLLPEVCPAELSING